MSDSPEKKLVNAFAEAWNEAAATLLGQPSELGLLALREVRGDDMESALAVAVTWSSAFAIPCSGAMSGVFVCLFKGEDSDEIEKLAGKETDGRPKPGGRAVIDSTLGGLGSRLGAEAPTFGENTWLDLAADVSRLGRVAGDTAWIGTCSLSLGDNTTQALLIYAPHGSMESLSMKNPAPPQPAAPPVSSAAAPAASSPASAPIISRRSQRQPEAPRNIERLLDVELEIIVRFGAASLPLREVARFGVGTMIELDRAVDEPVELLVNGRPLARGNVVVIDGYYGVRITEIGEPAQRPISIS